MNYQSNFFVVLFTTFFVLVAGIDVAEAKRLGGASSFGSKFSHSQSLKKNSTQRQASPALKQNAERKAQLAQQGGLMGMFGALALGGLLGMMFFGGAFEGVNFVDVLIFGLIFFLLFKLMTKKAIPAYANESTHLELNTDPYMQNQSTHEPASSQNVDAYLDDLRGPTPKEFDRAAFIDGAKSCFMRLQKSWDEGDLADIRQFTTDHVFTEIQDQYQNREGNSQTEILSLDAELLSASTPGSKQEAIVLFRSMLSENGYQHTVEEVWHFIKSVNSQQPTWFLDGIQQVQE